MMSDLPTVIDRGEPLATNVRRSDFSEAKRDVNPVSIRDGDNCDPLQVAHTWTPIIVTSFFISCNPILDRIIQNVLTRLQATLAVHGAAPRCSRRQVRSSSVLGNVLMSQRDALMPSTTDSTHRACIECCRARFSRRPGDNQTLPQRSNRSNWFAVVLGKSGHNSSLPSLVPASSRR